MCLCSRDYASTCIISCRHRAVMAERVWVPKACPVKGMRVTTSGTPKCMFCRSLSILSRSLHAVCWTTATAPWIKRATVPVYWGIPSVHCILGAPSTARKHLPISRWVRRSTISMRTWPMRSSSMLLSPTILTTLPTKQPRFCAKQPASGRMWAALPSAAAANTASAP